MVAALLFVIALLSYTPAFAQGGNGEIWGRVTETTGQVVDHATVTLTNVDTEDERTTRSDSRGRFAFPAVGAGRYQVTAQRDGFAGRRQDDIVLVPGQRLQLELPLRRAPLPETIALNPYPPIAESARTHVGAFIAETEIRDLPAMGRRYMVLPDLAPAVSQDAATGGISVMNLPSSQNRVVVDGFDHTSSITGEPLGVEGPMRVPYQVSEEAIEGLRIQTNAATAEVGHAAAATFNVVTRAGSNSLRGSAYDFFGDRGLNGERTIDEKAGLEPAPYRNNQFGMTIGGPISKEHNFFFVSYDGLRLATAAPDDQQQNLLLARTDHEFGGQHLMLRYMDQQYDGEATEIARAPSLVRNRSGAASLASAGGWAVNEARAQYARNHDEASSPLNLHGPHDFATDRVQFGDSLSWIAGAHAYKAGGDLIMHRNTGQFFPGSIAPLSARADLTQYGAFVQDAWRATSAVTVDLGVRYDRQDFASAMPRDANNWAPRIGMAFAPGERKNVFRAAYGLFYGSTPALIPALDSLAPVTVDPSFKTARVHQASAGWEIEKYRAGSLGIDYLFARGERLPRAVDVNIGSAYAALPERVVSFQSTGQSIYNGATLHARARVLQQLFYTIAYTFARSDETPQQPIGMVFGDDGARRTLAVQGATLQTRYPGNNDEHQHLVASAMYDTSLLAVDKHGLSKRLLKDWEYGVVYRWHTGNPYSAYVNGDLNGDWNPFNDLAPGTTWNQYRLPYQGSFDPRVTRRFRFGSTSQLSLIWEAFNLTNRPNYTAVDNTRYLLVGSALVPNPDFGRKTGQLNGRMMQLAARLTF